MKEMLARWWLELVGRIDGPMAFRFILQPLAASIIAIRAGLKDAREGRPPYFWSIFYNPIQRRETIREGWKHIAKVFIAAIVIDSIYQIVVFRWFYPLQTLIVAIVLAVLPYLVIRGLVNRIPRRGHRATVRRSG